MSDKIIKVSLEVPGELGGMRVASARVKAHEAAVLTLWEAGEISSSRAAMELDLSIHEFLNLLSAKGLPIVRGELDLQAIEEASDKLAGRRS